MAPHAWTSASETLFSRPFGCTSVMHASPTTSVIGSTFVPLPSSTTNVEDAAATWYAAARGGLLGSVGTMAMCGTLLFGGLLCEADGGDSLHVTTMEGARANARVALELSKLKLIADQKMTFMYQTWEVTKS